MYILGDTFLRSFVSQYDYTNKKVKMAINTNAVANTQLVSNPTETNVLLIAVLAVGAVLLMYCCCKKKKEEFMQSKGLR